MKEFLSRIWWLMLIALIAGPVEAGVDLRPSAIPNTTIPLQLRKTQANKIVAAWAIVNAGSTAAKAFDLGFYVDGNRVMGLRIKKLAAGRGTWHDQAPIDRFLPDGEHLVEIRVNDTRLIAEDSYSNNSFAIRVTISRSGTQPAQALTREQASLKWPSNFETMEVSEMFGRAKEMHEFEWTPKSDFKNWLLSGFYSDTYKKSVVYRGLVYSQAKPTDKRGFLGYLPRMSGTLNASSSAGIDCSAFIGWAWKLTSRPNTSSLMKSGSEFSVVIGKGNVSNSAHLIRRGDAIVSDKWTPEGGHGVMVYSVANGKVKCYEATTDIGFAFDNRATRNAVVFNERSLSDMNGRGCVVVRRSRIRE